MDPNNNQAINPNQPPSGDLNPVVTPPPAEPQQPDPVATEPSFQQAPPQPVNSVEQTVTPSPLTPEAQPEIPAPPPQPAVQPQEQMPSPDLAAQPDPTAKQPIAGNMPVPNQPKTSKKKLIATPVIIVLIAILVSAAGVFAFRRFSSSIKLEDFSNNQFSIKIPEGYEKDVKDSVAVFKEPAEDEDTASAVLVFIDDIPGEVTEDQRQEAFELIEKELDTLVESSSRPGQEITDKSTERTTFKGFGAIALKATVEQDGKAVGNVHMTAGLSESNTFIIMVLAHVSDPDVDKNAGRIIDSLEFK